MPEFLRRVARLVPHFINTTTFAARDFRPRRGASNDVWAEKNRRPQGCVAFRFWRCCSSVIPTGRDGGCSLVPTCRDDRGATTPEPKSDATLRAAVLFGPDVVARALQTPEGYARRSRSSGPKIPRRKRGRIYEMGYLVGAGGS